MKRCKCCGKTLDLSCFHRNPEMKDGHINVCRTCKRDYDRSRHIRTARKVSVGELMSGWGR